MSEPVNKLNVRDEEDFWSWVRSQFSIDRTLTYLSSGAMSATSLAAAQTQQRIIENTNLAPAYVLGVQLQPALEDVRNQLAYAFRCSPEELAFARNSTFGMDQCIFGIPLERGDEVLLSDQEFPAMIRALQQRAEREGIVVRQFPVPVPYQSDEQFCLTLQSNFNARTKLLMLSQVTYTTGQLFPIRRAAALASEHGIPTLVDGAQGFAHFPSSADLLGCQYYVTSLHKWLCAPPTSGFLFVSKPLVLNFFPLMPPKTPMPDNIRKLEQTGAQELASLIAVPDALALERAIGAERKAIRLRNLTLRWIEALQNYPQVHLLTKITDDCPRGMATIHVDGIPSSLLADRLWSNYRILVDTISTPVVDGIRISAQIYTSEQDIGLFISAMREILHT
jgi:selenocysteine lyase/cysteine desulfurase